MITRVIDDNANSTKICKRKPLTECVANNL